MLKINDLKELFEFRNLGTHLKPCARLSFSNAYSSLTKMCKKKKKTVVCQVIPIKCKRDWNIMLLVLILFLEFNLRVARSKHIFFLKVVSYSKYIFTYLQSIHSEGI